jgi:hypothetical protein
VAKDDGGRLISHLVQLEAILAQPEGTLADPTTGRIYPAPPLLNYVTDSSSQFVNCPLVPWFGGFLLLSP